MARGSDTLSLKAARRIALAAQGFGAPAPATVTRAHLARTIDRLGLHQIDSVNVLARAHYLPAFSRLGAYDRALLDGAAWGRKSQRRLFEYWAHEASLLPLALHPLLRWRMEQAARGERGWKSLRAFAHSAPPGGRRDPRPDPRRGADGRLGLRPWQEPQRLVGMGRDQAGARIPVLVRPDHHRDAARQLRARLRPHRAGDPGRDPRSARRPTRPTPHRALVEHRRPRHGRRHRGGPARLFPARSRRQSPRRRGLVEDGRLLPVTVEGWRQPAFLHPEARHPRRIAGQALLVPFDPLIWERARTERLFGFRYRIEIYTPAHKRLHGYYVLPFLMDGALVARVDLKSDRQNGRAARAEGDISRTWRPPETRERLAAELGLMAGWLGLGGVTGTT